MLRYHMPVNDAPANDAAAFARIEEWHLIGDVGLSAITGSLVGLRR
jgi:hypothetical protein